MVRPEAVIGIFPASSQGDDIILQKNSEIFIFHGLRQQVLLDTENAFCLSDFLSPERFQDFLGVFACQAGVGVEGMKRNFEAEGLVDKSILVEALADRLAEALAELVHEKMRKEFWGYAASENLNISDLLKVKYQGIRPAPGYPSQPDHREKRTLWDLLEIDKITNHRFTLTESHMMQPASAVCALCFAHPEAKYFSLGPIAEDQAIDYARRTDQSVEETERWLGSTVLGYK
jgi:5-methyltetrahydrofolate--homocysteine methyltransferase